MTTRSKRVHMAFRFRTDGNLCERIKAAAVANNRSINEEVYRRLEQSFTADDLSAIVEAAVRRATWYPQGASQQAARWGQFGQMGQMGQMGQQFTAGPQGFQNWNTQLPALYGLLKDD